MAKKFSSWYQKNTTNKNIARVGGVIILLLIGKSLGGVGGGGGVEEVLTMKLSDGSTLELKEENVFCSQKTRGNEVNTECTANGVITALNGKTYNFNQSKWCDSRSTIDGSYKGIEELSGIDMLGTSRKSIACVAAKKMNLY